MDQQTSQQVEQQLRTQWASLCPRILDRFTTVTKADLDAARSADDLVRRISDRTHYSERYVETEIFELAGIASGGGSSNPMSGGSVGSAQSAQSSQQGQQPFGSSQSR